MASKRTAEEAAKAVNALLHFCDEDQQPLLEVLEDYFDTPFEGELESEGENEETFSDHFSDDRGVCMLIRVNGMNKQSK